MENFSVITAYAFDYELHSEIIDQWLKKRGKEIRLPPEEFLSDLGFIIDETACGFLYTTNSNLGWIEWVFSNPDKSKEERKEAIDMLFKLIEKTAINLGITCLCSSSGHFSYSHVLERNRFKQTDKDVTHYLKFIEQEN